jgi:hypothetical protein
MDDGTVPASRSNVQQAITGLCPTRSDHGSVQVSLYPTNQILPRYMLQGRRSHRQKGSFGAGGAATCLVLPWLALRGSSRE